MTKVRVNWGPTTDGSPVRLFQVYNTAYRNLHVLAPDERTAIEIAYTANHIHRIWDRKDKSYPHAAEVRNPSNDPRLAYHADLIEIAISQRLRGSVHIDGEKLYVGSQLVGH